MNGFNSASLNPRRAPEETGPFGKRNTRNTTGSARSRTRTGTPARKDNANVLEFGRLFDQYVEDEKAQKARRPAAASAPNLEAPQQVIDKVATECILYGYRDKGVEWKVIDKYERISLGQICEDYQRTDPHASPRYQHTLSGRDVVVRNLTADANRKSKRYAGGLHWIKVTFDSAEAADRACHFSPQQIDGYSIFCEIYKGSGPAQDVAILTGSAEANQYRQNQHKSRTLTTSQSTSFLLQPERSNTLPRSYTTNSLSYKSPFESSLTAESASPVSSNTVSSATATGIEQPQFTSSQENDSLTNRTPHNPDAEYMTHIPTVKRAVLRPATEALPPSLTMAERILRSIPILAWFAGGDIVGDGPIIKEDGTFDYEKTTWYWILWWWIDYVFGSDFCGVKEE